MNKIQLKNILQSIKNERRGGAPHEGWLKQNREILMMQVRNTTDARTKRSFGETISHFFAVFLPSNALLSASRAIGLFFLVIGTVFGGGLVSAEAYRDSIPGEVLYRMKLAVEKTQLLLAPNDEYRIRLRTEFADRRLDEAARLAEGGTDRQRLVSGVLAAFENEVLALENRFDTLRVDNRDDVVEMAKLMERKMAVYRNVLEKIGKAVPTAGESVARAKDLIDGAAIKAIAAIVEKHLAGDAQAPRAIVVNRFEDSIQQAEAKLDTVSRNIASDKAASNAQTTFKAKAAIAEAKELVKEEKYQAALVKIVEAAQLTKEVESVNEEETAAASEPGDGASVGE